MKRSLFFLMFLVCFSLVIAQEDFDNDGMPDSWEKKYNLKYDVNDAADDPDRDGITNLQEYKRGTNPLVSDIKVTFFAKVSGFLKESGIKILLGIAVLFIIFFVIRVISELAKLKKEKKKKKEEEKRKKEANAEPLLEKIETPKFTSPKERLLDEKKIGEAFEKKKKNKVKKKLKEKKREFLTEAFEEKGGMEKELHPLPLSFSSKIKKVKEGFKEEKKTEETKKERKEETTSIFDRLPKKE